MSRPTQYATIPKMGDADEVGIDGVTYTGAQLRAMIAMTTPTTESAELPDALDYEHAYAIRQGHEIAASDDYFGARPQIDTNDRRKVFQAGFERGWDAARKQGGA